MLQQRQPKRHSLIQETKRNTYPLPFLSLLNHHVSCCAAFVILPSDLALGLLTLLCRVFGLLTEASSIDSYIIHLCVSLRMAL